MLKIRLRRVGAKKQPSYRLVVADSRAARDGRFIETIGNYNPRTDPPTVVVYEDRALHWLAQGAQPSDAVARFFEKLGLAAKVKQIHAGATIESVAAPRPVRETPAAPPAARRKAASAPAAETEGEAKSEGETETAAEAPTVEAAPEPVAASVPAPATEKAVEPTPEGPAATPVEEAHAEEAHAASELLALGLSARVAKALEDAGITTESDLAARLAEGADHLIALPGIGAKAVEEITARLAERGR